MALTKIRLGTKEDGSPLYHYHAPDSHVVITGPITGKVTTADGTEYDVTEDVIEVDPSHAAEVGNLIGQRYADEGHPSHTDGTPFVHIPVGKD